MPRFISKALLFAGVVSAALAQNPITPPRPLQATTISQITSITLIDCGIDCIDNRSTQYRRNNYHSYRATGSGVWSVDMQFAEGSPSGWVSFGNTAQVNNSTPASGVGFGIGYHDYVRFVITGLATVQNYWGTKDAWFLNTVGAIAFPVTVNQGGCGSIFDYGCVRNLGYLASFTGGVDRTVQSKLADVFSVKDFGATGDGVTDDTAAIRVAITAACTVTGAELYFPAGTYLTAKTSTAAVPIYALCSGLGVRGAGPGTSIKIKDSSGSFWAIFGGGGALSNVTIENLTINENSTNNPIPNVGDVATHPRIAFHTGNGGNNNVVRNVRITDVRCQWAIFLASTNSSAINNVIDNVGGGAVGTDVSLIYVESRSAGAIISGNRVVAAARNINMAVTAIETHSTVTVVGNIITDMLNGANITGLDVVTVSGVNITGNTFTGGYECLSLWSGPFSTHTTGYGLEGVVVSGNTCVVNQRSYLSVGQAGQGITMTPAGLPFHNIKITGNQVTYDLSNDATDPVGTGNMGIGYWDFLGNSGCDNCDFSDNSVINAPANAYRWSADGSNISFDNNIAINPGSSPNPALNSAFRAGIFMSTGSSPITGYYRVSGGTYIDNLPTARMGYGIEMATLNTSGIVIARPYISCSDPVCASLVKAITPNTALQLPYIDVLINVPAGKQLPTVGVAINSTFNSLLDHVVYTWNGSSFIFATAHLGLPGVDPAHPGSCGVGPAFAGNDRGGAVLMGTGPIATCYIAFNQAFTTQPYGAITITSSVGSPVFAGSSTATTFFSISGTNLAGNVFQWSFPLAN